MEQEGAAIVYCEGAFNTTYGKTAHGLVRFTRRYRVMSVIDSRYAGMDSGRIIDGRPNDIPVVHDLAAALQHAGEHGDTATHFVIGIAPDGGYMSPVMRRHVIEAIEAGLNVDSGLHEFLTEDEEIERLAAARGVTLRDIRKPPERKDLHFFSGKIEEVTALKIALLGTDSAIGKRTTAWILAKALNDAGIPAEMIGTGQTSWLQRAQYSLILDSLVNDFVAGEIEHVVHSAWKETNPSVIIIEGQGSLMNPAFPGGFEIMAAGRPDIVILQHAPARKEYDGFPGYRLHPLARQIEAIELLSEKKVVAITINHEGIPPGTIAEACRKITEETGLPAFDCLAEGADGLMAVIIPYIHAKGDTEAKTDENNQR